MPKIINLGGNLTKLRQKRVGKFILAHPVELCCECFTLAGVTPISL